jgi:D-sedoheptulose 7-phosphate isomerase
MDAGHDLLFGRDVLKRLPFADFGADYVNRLMAAAERAPFADIERLAAALIDCWRNNGQFFIFGNGGSAGNAVHLANDFLYGVSQKTGHGLRVHALSANYCSHQLPCK